MNLFMRIFRMKKRSFFCLRVPDLTQCSARGFTLIELLISLLISSFIVLGLFTFFTQLNMAMRSGDRIISLQQRALLVYEQLERDLNGAFKPCSAEQKEKKALPVETGQDGAPRASKAEEKKELPLTHIFHGTAKEGVFELLTCITANPLQVYWSDQLGVAKPRIARVVYRLLKEKGESVSYRLVRQEAYAPLAWEPFALDSAQPIKPRELISGIKECSVVYTAVIEKKDKDTDGRQGAAEKNKKEDKKKLYEYKELKEWILPAPDAADKKEEKKDIPDFVTMKIVLWDELLQREEPFEFTWAIGRAIFNDFEKEQEASVGQKKKLAQKAESKELVKQRFVSNMNKMKALQENRYHKQMARERFKKNMHVMQQLERERAIAGFKHTQTPDEKLQIAHLDQAEGRVFDRGSSRMSATHHSPEQAALPGEVIRVGQRVQPEQADYSADFLQELPEWVYDAPPEVQEQVLAHYKQMYETGAY